MNTQLKQWFDEHEEEIKGLASAIWMNPEPSLEEYFACSSLAEYMEKNGFEVETYNCKAASKPANCVIASYGSGSPVIGLIGEYDALPDLGQEAVPYRKAKDGFGHGCGHALMSPASVAAAVAVKQLMEKEGLKGTLKFFGCPAEEIVEGKLLMAGDGKFEGLDCCLAWHPGPSELKVYEFIQNSMASVTFEFYGKAAHAAKEPDKGRSALDACELMNVGVNYLREHMPISARIHYSYLNGGGKPNVVPAYASLDYFVRSTNVAETADLLEKVENCARGASIMTGTEYKMTVKTMACGCIQVSDFNQFVYESVSKVPDIEYTEEELAFAKELFTNINEREPAEGESVVFTTINAPTGKHTNTASSTDSGIVSHKAPLCRINGLALVKGTPGHSWGTVAAVGSPIGLKACIYVGKGLAQTAYDILTNPDRVEAWKEDMKRQDMQDDINRLVYPPKE